MPQFALRASCTAIVEISFVVEADNLKDALRIADEAHGGSNYWPSNDKPNLLDYEEEIDEVVLDETGQYDAVELDDKGYEKPGTDVQTVSWCNWNQDSVVV